jgi:hypothetical protein
MRKLRIALIILVVILLLAVGGFVVWANTPPAPMPAALEALQSDALVSVETDRWLVFMPADPRPEAGFIFYPGGRVDVRSYAPVLRQISEMGFLVVAVPMPLNLAFFGQNSADEVIQVYGDLVNHWAIGGHSLGGAMAGRYAHDHADTIDGLVLWASFVEESFSLADRNLLVTSSYGTRDGLAQPDSIDTSRATLPPDTVFVAIDGGNHAQFGDYGDQAGDLPATISREDQQEQVISATIMLLERIVELP